MRPTRRITRDRDYLVVGAGADRPCAPRELAYPALLGSFGYGLVFSQPGVVPVLLAPYSIVCPDLPNWLLHPAVARSAVTIAVAITGLECFIAHLHWLDECAPSFAYRTRAFLC